MTRTIIVVLIVVGAMLALVQCEDKPAAPEIGDMIATVSGDNQYSFRGTELPDPLVVFVRNEDGSIPKGASVVFTALQGGGSVSRGLAAVGRDGRASTRYTLGPATGINTVRGAISGRESQFVEFRATSSNFFCPEAEDTFKVSYGTAGHIFLATDRSSLYPANAAGVVRVNPFVPPSAGGFAEIPPFVFVEPVIFDAAFSPRGDFFVARRVISPAIVKIAPNGVISTFASLDTSPVDDAVELASNPIGLLVGVDLKGPFVVRCRDTLIRFPEAAFTDGVNNDALAVDPRRQATDPLGGDVYFIYKPDATLRRLALDSLTVEARGMEIVTQLTSNQAGAARGMVCDGGGDVYVLVDSDATKMILRVTPSGAQSVVIDFFAARGQGNAAGMQRDLALRNQLLYTLDTFNDQLLEINFAGQFRAVFADSIEQSKLSARDRQGNPFGGERVGLAVLR